MHLKDMRPKLPERCRLFAAAEPAAPVAGVGQEVRDGRFAFVVAGIDRSRVAGDLSNQFMRE
jgi:hypothetical protein